MKLTPKLHKARNDMIVKSAFDTTRISYVGGINCLVAVHWSERGIDRVAQIRDPINMMRNIH